MIFQLVNKITGEVYDLTPNSPSNETGVIILVDGEEYQLDSDDTCPFLVDIKSNVDDEHQDRIKKLLDKLDCKTPMYVVKR